MIRALWFRFVLLALFLFAYQTTATHTKHHLAKELSECKVCQASKHLDTTSHQTTFIVFADITAVEVEAVLEKIIVKDAFDLTQTPDIKRRDYTGYKQFYPKAPQLTYQALAPPIYVS